MKILTPSERLHRLQQENEALRARANQIETAANILFVKMVEKGEIDEQTALEHIDMFSPWLPNENYTQGEYRKYEGALYKCLANQKMARDYFAPDRAKNYWQKVGSTEEVVREWSKPICEIDGYSTGDRVIYDSQTWRSTANKNVSTPGVGYWTKID